MPRFVFWYFSAADGPCAGEGPRWSDTCLRIVLRACSYFILDTRSCT
jgi:hypothetical protein